MKKTLKESILYIGRNSEKLKPTGEALPAEKGGPGFTCGQLSVRKAR